MRPAILERLQGVQRSGKGWLAFCPAHNDVHKRSLSIGVGDDARTLLKCHAAGCTPEQITHAVNMTMADLAPPTGRTNGHGPRDIVATYDFCDERGDLLYQEVRLAPKDFRLRRPDGRGGWTWNLDGVRRVVYRLDELAEQRRVFLVEGPKDADNLAALGIVATTTPGGAKAWRAEYAQQIASAGVGEVIACRDNDAPGLAYVRAAAADLAALNLTVRMLELPGVPERGDVSDWIDAQRRAGRADAEIRAALLTLAEAAPHYTPDTSDQPGATTVPDAPVLAREGLDLSLAWPDGVRLALAAIRDSRDGGVRGELTVTLAGRHLSWGTLALASTSAREGLRKKLDAATPGIEWGERLETAALLLTRAAREGEPLVTLTGTASSPTRELLPGMLYEGEPTQIYADGDTGKSLVATALAAAMHSGAALPFGLKPARPVPAAYLDWETSRDTLEERLGKVAAGLGIDPPPVLYKRMTRPLVDEAAALAADFARRGIGFVVIDSKMFAVAGGDGAAFHEPITAFYNALRLFAPAAVLVLNHVTGADARGGGPARPFGGAFAWNGPRLIWEAKRDPDVTDATAIAFTCRKANNLPRRPDPFGLRFVPGDGVISVYPFDLAEAAPQTVAGASLPYRVRLALASADLSIPELAEQLGVSKDLVGRTVRRLHERGTLTKVGDTSTTGGRGNLDRWRLASDG
jgi:hypothetical protein